MAVVVKAVHTASKHDILLKSLFIDIKMLKHSGL